MSESIFTTQTPGVANANDSTQYTLGVAWTPAVNGSVTGARAYVASTPPASLAAVLYSITSESAGTELARKTYGALTGGAWNSVTFDSPVSVSTGTYYVICYLTPDRFVLTDAAFTSAGITNGNLTAIQSGSPYGNGRIHVGDGFPEITSGNKANYFADVLFTASGGGQSAAVGLATETDTAVAVGEVKARTLGVAGETDTAVPLARTKTRALGLATETDLAVAIDTGTHGPVGARIVASSRVGWITSSSPTGRTTRGGGG